MTKIAQNTVAKFSVALVTAAMLFTLVAPAQAATVEELQAQIAALMAQISALQGSTGTTTGGSCVSIAAPLTIGSKGADVTALQNRLIAAGQSIPAGATGYFGTQTQAAVAAWQAANGVAPAAGYYGPITKAAMDAKCVPTTPTTPTTPGEGDDGKVVLEGGAGSINVTQTTSDVEDDINTGGSENILGFKVEAQGSDVEVTNVKITMVYTGSASNRLERYFDSFDIVMDGEVVGSIEADDMNRDSSGNYSGTVALKDAVILENDKPTFYVVANAVSSMDSANSGSTWTADIDSVRYRDGMGAILTDNASSVSANTGINVVKLASSTDVKVKVSLDSSNPAAGTVKVSDDSSGDTVTLLTFKVKAEGTDVDFDQVRFKLATTGAALSTMVSEYRLMQGSDIVQTADSSDVAATTSQQAILTMSLDDSEMVDQDDTVTYSLVAKMNKNTFVGSSITASIGSAAPYWLNANDANGDAIASARFSGSAVGNEQTFRADGLYAEITSTKADLLSIVVSNTTKQYGEFTFVMDVTADGEDYYFASTSAPIAYQVLNSAGTPLISASSTAVLSSDATKTANGDYVIYDGQTKSVTYKVTMKTGAAATAYKAVANTFDFGDAANALTNQTAVSLTPVSDFTTGSVTIQ